MSWTCPLARKLRAVFHVVWLGLAPAAPQADAAQTPQEILATIAQRCEPWLGPPSENIRSLRYTFDLHGDKRTVEVVPGVTGGGRSFRQGITLNPGLFQLLANTDAYELTLEDDGGEWLILVAKRDRGFRLSAGNGVSGSWRGYFSARSDQMTLQLHRDTLLPAREIHDGTEFVYKQWLKVATDRWVPQQIDVLHGDMVFQMHFQWREDVLWILHYSDYALRGKPASVARVTEIVLNDQQLVDRVTKEQKGQMSRRSIITTMLDHNKPWLEPALSTLDSIEYTFRTVREDVDETCYLERDGTVIFEVSRDGQGKVKDSLGKRRIILPDGKYYISTRGQAVATLQPQGRERRDEPPFSEQLRRYGTIGIQFDLPLLRYRDRIEYANVRLIEETEWEGLPCHAVEVSGLGRCYFGAGTMLGFTSWSYVHHIVPQREVVYIDAKRHVPLHETLVSSRDGKKFEIEFKDHTEVSPGQWAPMRIEIRAKDYFTCFYNFQLTGGSHWMLKDCVSWFQPDNKSRGEILNVRMNEESALRRQALAQIKATNGLLLKPPDKGTKTGVASYPFRVGKRIPVAAGWGEDKPSFNPYRETEEKTFSAVKEVLFTLNPSGDLVAHCKFVSSRFHKAFPITINAALLGERGELLGADGFTTSVQLMNELFVRDFTLNFGKHEHLRDVKRFSVQLVRGGDTAFYHGHGMWMREAAHSRGDARHPATEYMAWDLADGLTADDPALRSVALERLFFHSKVAMEHTHSESYRQWLRRLEHGEGKLSHDDLFPRDERRELIEPLLWLRERTTDARDRLLITLALGWFGDPKVVPALASSYEDGATTERLAAATSLGILGDRRGFKEIVAALKGDSAGLRMNAVWALAELGGPESVGTLCEALFHQKPWSEPAPRGGAYFHDPYGITRRDVQRALVALRDKTGLRALNRLKKDAEDYGVDDSEVRSIIRFLEDGK